MKNSSKELIRKLTNSRPKPKPETLRNLFIDIQSSSVETLLAEFTTTLKKTGTRKKASPLEAHTKSSLRRIKGKVGDFLPYLIQAASKRDASSISKLRSAKSLAANLAHIQSVFGNQSKSIVDEALERFTTENDVSYRLDAN